MVLNNISEHLNLFLELAKYYGVCHKKKKNQLNKNKNLKKSDLNQINQIFFFFLGWYWITSMNIKIYFYELAKYYGVCHEKKNLI